MKIYLYIAILNKNNRHKINAIFEKSGLNKWVAYSLTNRPIECSHYKALFENESKIRLYIFDLICVEFSVHEMVKKM
jgi:hypothetical protein